MRKFLALATLIAVCTFALSACVKKKADPLDSGMNCNISGGGPFNLPYCFAITSGSVLSIRGTATADGSAAPFMNFVLTDWNGGLGTCQLSSDGSTGATMVLAMTSDGQGVSFIAGGQLTITYINGPEMRGIFNVVLVDGTKLTDGTFVAERQ